MRLVTIVSLAVSAILGLGALFLAKIVLPNNSNAKASPAAAPINGVPVVVASRDIKYGVKLEPAMLTVVTIPANAAPQGAFNTVAQVLAADKGGAPVVLFPLAAREALVPAKLSGPGSRPSVAAAVAEGMRAYTIKVDDVSGVGGHALPGDHIDVVLMRDLTPTGETRTYVSQIVIQNVRVLGVDLNADITTDKPASPNTATLEVTVEDAQKLAVAATLGHLSLALRRTGAAEIDETVLLRTSDFLVGGARAPGPVRTGGAPRSSYGGGILIVEGESAKRARKSRTAAPMSAPAPATAAAKTDAPADADAAA